MTSSVALFEGPSGGLVSEVVLQVSGGTGGLRAASVVYIVVLAAADAQSTQVVTCTSTCSGFACPV